MEGYTTKKLKDGEVAVTSDKTGKTYDTNDPKKLERDHEVFENIKKDDPDGMTPDKDVKKLENEIVDDDVVNDYTEALFAEVKDENEALKKELQTLKDKVKANDAKALTDDIKPEHRDIFELLMKNLDDPAQFKKDFLKDHEHYRNSEVKPFSNNGGITAKQTEEPEDKFRNSLSSKDKKIYDKMNK